MITIPRTPKLVPETFDPHRRLLAAIVIRAIKDVARPPQNLSPAERQSARSFVENQTDLIAAFAQTSELKIKQLLGVRS